MQLIHGDTFETLDRLCTTGLDGTVDLVVTDPPYFLGKAAWDTPRAHWEVVAFHEAWLASCRDLLAPNGSMWVSGDKSSIYAIGDSLQRLGFVVINAVAWQRPNPRPIPSRDRFKHSFELLIWAKRSKTARPFFDYELMRQHHDGRTGMGTVWMFAPATPWEKRYGRHPTQKPEALIERIVLATSLPGALVLDPFVGSGTTAVAAVRHQRRVIGIDQDARCLAIARRRIDDEVKPDEAASAALPSADAA